MDSHSYKNVDDENPLKKNMESHLYRNVHDKTYMNMDSHSYRNMHDKNPYTKKRIVVSTEMFMTKINTRRIWIVNCTKM